MTDSRPGGHRLLHCEQRKIKTKLASQIAERARIIFNAQTLKVRSSIMKNRRIIFNAQTLKVRSSIMKNRKSTSLPKGLDFRLRLNNFESKDHFVAGFTVVQRRRIRVDHSELVKHAQAQRAFARHAVNFIHDEGFDASRLGRIKSCAHLWAFFRRRLNHLMHFHFPLILLGVCINLFSLDTRRNAPRTFRPNNSSCGVCEMPGAPTGLST